MKNSPSGDMKSGTRDEIEGSAKKLAGRVKEGLGKALGNPDLEGRGNREKLEGEIQKERGELRQAIGR